MQRCTPQISQPNLVRFERGARDSQRGRALPDIARSTNLVSLVATPPSLFTYSRRSGCA